MGQQERQKKLNLQKENFTQLGASTFLPQVAKFLNSLGWQWPPPSK